MNGMMELLLMFTSKRSNQMIIILTVIDTCDSFALFIYIDDQEVLLAHQSLHPTNCHFVYQIFVHL